MEDLKLVMSALRDMRSFDVANNKVRVAHPGFNSEQFDYPYLTAPAWDVIQRLRKDCASLRAALNQVIEAMGDAP